MIRNEWLEPVVVNFRIGRGDLTVKISFFFRAKKNKVGDPYSETLVFCVSFLE